MRDRIFTLDIPLLVAGLSYLVWLRVRRRNDEFQAGCQLVGTFWAQYPFVVSWSLAKLVPMLSATYAGRNRIKELSWFLPFVVYALAGTLFASSFWEIPEGVSWAYGEARVWVQLANLVAIVLATRALANALLSDRAPRLLWDALTVAVLVHGGFTIYQFMAWYFGWPLVGISRAHGDTLIQGMADIAVFETGFGLEMVRPSGLAGEPKTAAVLYGMYLLTHMFAGYPGGIGRVRKWMGLTAVALAFIGYLLAFSTSVFLGSVAAFLLLLMLFRRNVRPQRFIYVIALFVGIVLIWQHVNPGGMDNLIDLLQQRTVGRLQGDMDPPVEASMEALRTNTSVLLFGTGAGGSSFLVMKYFGFIYDYAFAPSIGFVLILVEHGIVGTLLLMVPVGVIFLRFLSAPEETEDKWRYDYLRGMGISTFCIILSGSGIALGPALAIGCLTAGTRNNRPPEYSGVFSCRDRTR